LNRIPILTSQKFISKLLGLNILRSDLDKVTLTLTINMIRPHIRQKTCNQLGWWRRGQGGFRCGIGENKIRDQSCCCSLSEKVAKLLALAHVEWNEDQGG